MRGHEIKIYDWKQDAFTIHHFIKKEIASVTANTEADGIADDLPF